MWDRIAPSPRVVRSTISSGPPPPTFQTASRPREATKRSRDPGTRPHLTTNHRRLSIARQETLQQAIATIAFFQDHRIAATRPVIIPRLRRVSGPQHPFGPSKTAMRAEVSRVISLAACPLLPTKPSRYNTPHYHQDPDHTRANSPH